ncbi:uncharacterized protein LOC141618030 [Silene latifolia]|uniref:uncharacterized protein LOC141618030 n=1 Tax=Silene latifolia TaxID=37657 RepID=UPI003D788697
MTHSPAHLATPSEKPQPDMHTDSRQDRNPAPSNLSESATVDHPKNKGSARESVCSERQLPTHAGIAEVNMGCQYQDRTMQLHRNIQGNEAHDRGYSTTHHISTEIVQYTEQRDTRNLPVTGTGKRQRTDKQPNLVSQEVDPEMLIYSYEQDYGPYTFRISGQNSHFIGSLLPVGERPPSFLQLYIYDTTSELDMRVNVVRKDTSKIQLDKSILSGLKNMLDEINPLAKTFRMAQQRIKEDKNINLSIRILGHRDSKAIKDRVYNSLTVSEVAALIVGDAGGANAGRDIIVEHKEKGLKRINELHPSFIALQYPLLFPYGEDGYHVEIEYYEDVNQKKKTGKRKRVTMREYYAYRIQQRVKEGYALLRGGKLLHQFIVDCYCAIESERLLFIRYNQPSLRCDLLNNICDVVSKGDHVGAAVGTRIILPATFMGCTRYPQQNYQDEMAKCRWFGNPHLFITFTANLKWPEVESMLKHIKGQKAEDRPDIIARVFKLKLRQLMDHLKKERYFGTVVADVYTIEFQKRGLPHAHILLWIKPEEIDLTTQFIDNIICAEIPDKEKEPEQYTTVSRYMVHGPCGRMNPNCSCMINNTCSKKFPKQSNQETVIDNNGYPVYRRRENDRYVQKGDHRLDNRYIVPYNPGLLLMFEAHLNVEWCNTARAIKYLFKYILKGPDKATMVLTGGQDDEIKSYLDCRYLSACESVWRIFEFDILERNPSVIRLPVHLEGEQAIVLRDHERLEVVIKRAVRRRLC